MIIQVGMRKSIIVASVLLLPFIAMAYTSPGKPQGYVSDFAGVMNTGDIQSIDTDLAAFEASTSDQIAVVTVPSIGNDETIETYATKLFAEWGIGKKGNDNGLLILVAPNDKQMRIEVGYGLEGNVTDLVSNNIIQKVMIPAFKTGDYSGGIRRAVDAVTGVISGSADATQYLDAGGANTNQGFGNGSGINVYALFFVGIVILNILAHVLGRTKSWWLGGVIGAVVGTVVGFIFGFVSIGLIAIIVLTILGLVFDFIVSKHPPGSGPGRSGGIWPIMFFGGGRGGNGGSGGGFGGFGGGMSGGGGASGRW
jgi:uncharacterized protein